MAGSSSEILKSLAVNVAIAAAKGVAAAFTGSGALLAETVHSSADCTNQILLLLGVKQAARPPDASHPMGYGRNLYFWSFVVALLLFSGGGVFSIYEGIHKLARPEAVDHVGWGIIILLFSLLLEGWATVGNLREMKVRRGKTPLVAWLRETKDSDLIVVFGENSAAVLGLTFALAALGLSLATGDGRWDAAGSIAVGLVLVGVAVFLAIEVKSLLIGEAADANIVDAVHASARRPGLTEVLRIIAIQQGPGEVMVALKVRAQADLRADDLVTAINALERDLKSRRPEVRWCFVEPDIAA
jgi:cation diffusion facilitator family transporter